MLGVYIPYRFRQRADQSRAWQQALMHIQSPCWALRTSWLCDIRYHPTMRL